MGDFVGVLLYGAIKGQLYEVGRLVGGESLVIGCAGWHWRLAKFFLFGNRITATATKKQNQNCD
jgi:hypothetical protein